MIWVHYIESAGFEKKKESDKQIIHHKSTKHIPYISITGFTSLLSNKKHTHSIRPGILTTTKVLNYWGYLIICKTTEFRDSIPGINELKNVIRQFAPNSNCDDQHVLSNVSSGMCSQKFTYYHTGILTKWLTAIWQMQWQIHFLEHTWINRNKENKEKKLFDHDGKSQTKKQDQYVFAIGDLCKHYHHVLYRGIYFCRVVKTGHVGVSISLTKRKDIAYLCHNPYML